MKKITLDDVIQENIKRDAKFAGYYRKELLINAIFKIVVKIKNKIAAWAK